MNASPWTLLLLLAVASTTIAAAPVAHPRNVLLVGNSLSYVNNLPALLNAVAAGGGDGHRVHADMIAAPGGTISERWRDGVVAQEIASGRWNVLVLQEKGGVLACLSKPASREASDCAASTTAHVKFAELARRKGMRVILLGTWGPDSIWQGQLSRGLRKLAALAGAEALDLGPPVRAFAKAHPQTTMFTDEIMHPSLDASLMVALALHQRITGAGTLEGGMEIDSTPMTAKARPSPARLLSSQPWSAAVGPPTVIEVSRLDPLRAALAADSP